MKIKNATIRVKLIITIFASSIMAGICMIFLCILMLIGSLSRPFAIFFNQNIFLFVMLFLVIFIILVIVFFLILVKNIILRLEEITKTLDSISKGDLDIYIPVKSGDELGKMAETVNSMTSKLKASIEQERQMEKIKNDLITNISHDLRTPLTSTLGYLELITQTKFKDEEKIKHYSHIAYKQCNDLRILIDELFEYSKISNKGLTINKARIQMKEFLEQIVITFMPALEEAQMEYRLDVKGQNTVINADPVLLKRVFDNLINNAVKYGKDGKTLNIELDSEGEYVIVRIINYGITIPSEDISYVFEQFYRADKSRSGSIKGSGIGLAIVKSIMELHEGSINVVSLDNKTVFEAKFRAADGRKIQ